MYMYVPRRAVTGTEEVDGGCIYIRIAYQLDKANCF